MSQNIRNEILEIVRKIKPYDEIERVHIADAISWIQSGAEIFRIQKPDIPAKHLVSYFVLVDPKKQKILFSRSY
ncbi:MAG: hypothetical protein V4467_03665 [Patescibacteria group bacterium]